MIRNSTILHIIEWTQTVFELIKRWQRYCQNWKLKH